MNERVDTHCLAYTLTGSRTLLYNMQPHLAMQKGSGARKPINQSLFYLTDQIDRSVSVRKEVINFQCSLAANKPNFYQDFIQ